MFFFFQAEDGIRDYKVTGVQTCALPIYQALQMLDTGMPQNPLVKILQRPRGWIRVSPSEHKPDPLHLTQLKAEILQRWPMTSLLDVLKETDLRVHFTQCFPAMGTRTMLDRDTLQ